MKWAPETPWHFKKARSRGGVKRLFRMGKRRLLKKGPQPPPTGDPFWHIFGALEKSIERTRSERAQNFSVQWILILQNSKITWNILVILIGHIKVDTRGHSWNPNCFYQHDFISKMILSDILNYSKLYFIYSSFPLLSRKIKMALGA